MIRRAAIGFLIGAGGSALVMLLPFGVWIALGGTFDDGARGAFAIILGAVMFAGVGTGIVLAEDSHS